MSAEKVQTLIHCLLIVIADGTHCVWQTIISPLPLWSLWISLTISRYWSQCWCMVWKRGQSQRLLFGDWIPLTHGLSEKSFVSHIPDTLPMLLSGRVPAALQFPVSLRQDSSACLDTWNIQIPGKIITELSVCHSINQDIGGDLEGTHVRPDWGGLMLMYSWLTSISTQPRLAGKNVSEVTHFVLSGM